MSTSTNIEKNILMDVEGAIEVITFHVGDRWLGVDIREVQEINRMMEITPATNAPEVVAGLINLRGDVVTVVDLKHILHLSQTKESHQTRIVVVNWGKEKVGVMVDRVSDVVTIAPDELLTPPANLNSRESRAISAVYQGEHELLMVVQLKDMMEMTMEEESIE